VFDWIVVPAVILMFTAFVVCLATKPWLPRVSSVASGTMAVGLGIMALWVAVSALEKGVFEGEATSKILRHSVYRAQSPVAFWMYFTLFALPGFLLVTFPVYVLVLDIILWIQSILNLIKPEAKLSRDGKAKAKQ
jgi:hypothetical protein